MLLLLLMVIEMRNRGEGGKKKGMIQAGCCCRSDRPHSAPELGLEAGLPPVVMIMGLGAEHKAWIFQARKLCQTRLVLLLDNRGIGRSDVPKEEDAYTTGQGGRQRRCKSTNTRSQDSAPLF